MADRDVGTVFAEAVLRERLARDWSGTELARRAGIAQCTVSNIESGRYGTTLSVAARIAGAFGLPIGALADGPAGGGDRG
jgi:transcriptional regulator with XRE-family HTH domain